MTEWIEPIYDRIYSDVLEVGENPTMQNPKGAYNATDLNRIENNTQYVAEDMLKRKIVRVPPALAIKTNWESSDIPTREDMLRIVRNVQLLMELSNPIVHEDFKVLTETSQWTYLSANAIEYNLDIMKNQPDLPIQRFLLTVENGIIVEYNSDKAEIEEDEVVTIQGVPYGPDAQYMVFTRWSGEADDLQYVEDVNAQTTKFTGQFHEVTLTANFKTRFPRTLTLHGGRIYDDIGGTTRRFFAGDEVLLLADIAPSGKRFYGWTGTQAGIDNITGGPEPSTSWLIMPDCDVELTSKYINAGQHSVTVDGTLQGWYDYDETIFITPKSKGSKYSFAYWSGNGTAYLDDPTSSSFKMPDVNVTFTSVWNYIYSYNTVDVIDGTINNQRRGENLRENSNHPISANPAPEGYGFYHWELEGLGSISSLTSANTTFTVGDGNAILTAIYHKKYNLTIQNLNNNGIETINSYQYGKTVSVSTSSSPKDYEFVNWTDSTGKVLSSSTSYSFVMPEKDYYIVANYKYVGTYTVTVHNIDNSGGTSTTDIQGSTSKYTSTNELAGDYIFDYWRDDETGSKISTSLSFSVTITRDREFTAVYRQRQSYELIVTGGTGSGSYLERQSVTISATDIPSGYRFSSWSGNYHSIGGQYSSSTTIVMPSTKCTITAKYAVIPGYYTVTVNNGSGGGRYQEGTYITCTGNQAPNGYEFSHWIENDEIISYANPYRFYLGARDRELTAIYKEIPYFDVTVINGTGSGTYIRNSNPTITMNPAPEGMKFLQWEILEGDQNEVYQPLAETTYIRNLTHNVRVQATYYVPDPEIEYKLTVTGKDGDVEITNHHVGDQVYLYADYPDEGYRFYKWTGDTQYLIDKYAEQTIVNMPAKDISLNMEYRLEGYVTTYHVILMGGELLLETDPETGRERWDIEGEFEEGTVVKIRAKDIPVGFRFRAWENDEDEGLSVSTVADLTSPETTIIVEDFDIALTRGVTEIDQHHITVVNGEVSGSYPEGEPVAIYFNLESTETVHYDFVRWAGSDLAYIKLFDGGSFDIYNPGGDLEPGDDPQIIRMPTRDITITANYETRYRLKIEDGKTEDGKTEKFLKFGEEVKISADEPVEGSRFSHWAGNVECIDNPYNPNVSAIMPKGPIRLTAIYTLRNNQNDFALVDKDLHLETEIPISEINLISGELRQGCLISDTNGHLYITTRILEDTLDIVRLTKIQGGANDGE